jgi:hypothetical protein
MFLRGEANGNPLFSKSSLSSPRHPLPILPYFIFIQGKTRGNGRGIVLLLRELGRNKGQPVRNSDIQKIKSLLNLNQSKLNKYE